MQRDYNTPASLLSWSMLESRDIVLTGEGAKILNSASSMNEHYMKEAFHTRSVPASRRLNQARDTGMQFPECWAWIQHMMSTSTYRHNSKRGSDTVSHTCCEQYELDSDLWNQVILVFTAVVLNIADHRVITTCCSSEMNIVVL